MKAKRRWLRRMARWGGGLFVAAAIAFGLAWLIFPYPADRLDAYPASARIADKDGRLLRVYASERGELRFIVKLSEMGPWLPKATVAVEDRRFYSHWGIDWLAVLRAAGQDIARLRVYSGASTIPQQLVRILDERPRTLLSKAVEAFHALQLVSQRSKDDLLEAYLNLAPYGGNLRGVEAAAMRYFGKSARDLSLAEAALIAGLPQSPSRLRPDRHLATAIARRGVVFQAMVREGFITAAERDAAAAERPVLRARPWPFEAPHFADLARASARGTGGSIVATTLDRDMETVVESALASFFAADPAGRARLSGAVVVLEAATGAVRALVGSPDYFDVARRGTLDGALRPRSPGSALKPFTYALAYDRGIVLPGSLLFDSPAAYADFAPENFDRGFHGPISAAEALSLSLNVPAVRLQERVGTATLLGALRRLGFHTLSRSTARYGLTLTLGGGEVTLLDLTNAYAALVRHGTFKPWTVLAQPARDSSAARSSAEGENIFSPGLCELVLESLSSEEHLERAIPGGASWKALGVGYKTGTSHGFRDAWAVAFAAGHVVGVWIGDPAGKPHPDLIGLQAAAPIALGIAAELARRAPSPRAPASDGIAERPVCALTGFPAGKRCPRIIAGRYPAGAPAPPSCAVHREVLVDALSGLEVCPVCMASKPVVKKVVEVWPPEANIRSPLEHDPLCRAVAAAAEGIPRILSPTEGSEYRVRGGAPFEQKLFLSANASSTATLLHWFVNGGLIATASPTDRVPWPLERGAHLIRCVDDRGRGSVVRIRVR